MASPPRKALAYGIVAAVVMLGSLLVVTASMYMGVRSQASHSRELTGWVLLRHCEEKGNVTACWVLALSAQEREPAAAAKYWRHACQADESGAACLAMVEFCAAHPDLSECKQLRKLPFSISPDENQRRHPAIERAPTWNTQPRDEPMRPNRTEIENLDNGLLEP